MTNRREFLQASGVAALFSVLPWRTVAQEPTTRANRPSKRLRTITYNVLQCSGYPLDDNTRERLTVARRRMDARFAVELFAYEADIISFQESPSERVVASIAKLLGMNYCFFPSPGSWPGAILTRYDIRDAVNCPLGHGHARPRELFTRHFGRAVLATGDGELVVYSAHLYPARDAPQRMREVREIVASMTDDLESERSLLLQGDLNHDPEAPEYQLWMDAGLVDMAEAATREPQPTIPSIEPRRRIDYVMAHGPIAAKLSDCRVLFEGAFRTNPADPTSFALSDHLPVMATFS